MFRRRDNLLAWAVSTAVCGVVLLLSTANCVAARSRPAFPPPTGALLPPADFAIADLDGDRRPDLATVEIVKGSSSGDIRYSIRFLLTSGVTQAFGVTAPVGGLQIVAKDLNGDNALDILVSTAWQHRQVAVFINDGHGNFSPADPASFAMPPAAVETQYNQPCLPGPETLALASGSTLAEPQNRDGWTSPPRVIAVIGSRARLGLGRLVFRSRFGRAPPAVLPAYIPC